MTRQAKILRLVRKQKTATLKEITRRYGGKPSVNAVTMSRLKSRGLIRSVAPGEYAATEHKAPPKAKRHTKAAPNLAKQVDDFMAETPLVTIGGAEDARRQAHMREQYKGRWVRVYDQTAGARDGVCLEVSGYVLEVWFAGQSEIKIYREEEVLTKGPKAELKVPRF